MINLKETVQSAAIFMHVDEKMDILSSGLFISAQMGSEDLCGTVLYWSSVLVYDSITAVKSVKTFPFYTHTN